jgi:hypothetical protein
MSSDLQPTFEDERAKAVARVVSDNRQFRKRAVYEVSLGIASVVLLFINGVILEALGVPHNNERAGLIMGVFGFAALANFGLAAAHFCASFRRPVKTLMRPACGYSNAEDALAAAFQLDMHGDWDAANALYEEIARRWPDHAQYAQGRISEIEGKRSRASQP